jgi:hypothetical protein
VLHDLERTAAKLSESHGSNESLFKLCNGIGDDELTTDNLAKHLVIAQSAAARDYYQAYKYLEAATCVSKKIFDAKTLDDAEHARLNVFQDETLPGREVVGVLTTLQVC